MGSALPKTFGGYDVLELVERVGGTTIYLARQRTVDRVVTLTVLPPQEAHKAAFKKRFERQVLAASQLSHPNVAGAIDAGEVEGHHYIAAEYAGGQRLSVPLEGGEWFPTRRCRAIARDIAKALTHLESRRFVHRGVTPRAIQLAESGVSKLRGFSFSKILEPDGGETWFEIDAYAARYTSPEMVRMVDRVDTRGDIYSLGCVLFHTLTGRPPFEADSATAILEKHVSAPIPDPRREREDLPDLLRDVVVTCLQKKPERRYPSAQALLEALEGPSGEAPAPPQAESRSRRWFQRRRKQA